MKKEALHPLHRPFPTRKYPHSPSSPPRSGRIQISTLNHPPSRKTKTRLIFHPRPAIRRGETNARNTTASTAIRLSPSRSSGTVSSLVPTAAIAPGDRVTKMVPFTTVATSSGTTAPTATDFHPQVPLSHLILQTVTVYCSAYSMLWSISWLTSTNSLTSGMNYLHSKRSWSPVRNQ